jgi:adenylylsulfate kinase
MSGQMMIRPFFPWLIGPSKSINSQVGGLVSQALKDLGAICVFLEEDECLEAFWPEIKPSDLSAMESCRRMALLCRLLGAAGVVTVVACQSPDEALRREIRNTLGEYIEVYCKGHDPGPEGHSKGGEYDEPSDPELILAPGEQSVKESAQVVLTWLNEMGYLSPTGDTGESSEDQATVLKRLEELGYI